MKKEWNMPQLDVIDIKETAFGPYQPNLPDSDKTQITKPDGTTGWEQNFGSTVRSDN